MKASVLTGIRKVETRDYPKPSIKDHEVLIRVMDCGICGSDVHYYEHGKIGDFVVKEPMVLGHECAGEVAEAGALVKGLKPGDLVAVEPGHTCGKCEYCKTGRYNLCPDVVFLATPPYDGAFTEYLAYPADMVYKLPECMDTVEGALLEPFCVGLHAARQSGGKTGQSAVILGSGCIGLCTLMALNAMGITRVFMVDVIEKRLQMAKEIGAFNVINGKERDAVEAVLEWTGGEGADLVFETAGTLFTTQQTAGLVKRGGTIVLVGMAANPVFQFDFGTLMGKEARIQTVFRYRNLYPAAIELAALGMVDLKKIVTHRYAFDEIERGLKESIRNKQEIVKAVIHIGD